MAVVPFPDIISIALVIGVMLVLDIIGYATERGLFHVAAGVLGLFTMGDIATVGKVTYLVAYDQSLGTFTTYTIDLNIILVTMAIVTIVSFLFIYLERYA